MGYSTPSQDHDNSAQLPRAQQDQTPSTDIAATGKPPQPLPRSADDERIREHWLRFEAWRVGME